MEELEIKMKHFIQLADEENATDWNKGVIWLAKVVLEDINKMKEEEQAEFEALMEETNRLFPFDAHKKRA